jgi:hypothetical protein
MKLAYALQEGMNSDFEEAGFEILRGILSEAECDTLIEAMSSLAASEGKSAGLRNLLQKSPLVREFATSARITANLGSRLGKPVFPVRALFFDKTQTTNWRVSWHQDLTIAVAERIETPGFEAWSMKAGVTHVEAPPEILEGMATVRLHLDECTHENGPLHVVPGSHRFGKLMDQEIQRLTNDGKGTVCELSKGDALLMRPLLLHASWPAATPHHRRVIHIEYATQDLPGGLRWFELKH